MSRSFSLLCRVLAALGERDPGALPRFLLDLRGTMYGWLPGEAKPFEEMASRAGVLGCVREDPARVSYRKSLELVAQSDGLLVLGVDDPAYMPSKLFSYASTGRPLLAVIRRDGAAMAHMATVSPGVRVLWFDDAGDIPMTDALRELETFLGDVAERRRFERSPGLAPFMAAEMAGRHDRLFDTCLSS